jgi:rod shape-determining protein MreC
MITPKVEKEVLKSRQSSNLRILVWSVFILTAVLLTLGIYIIVRQSAMRMSADYYYPFLKLVRGMENTTADQLLLLQSKTKLASALQKLMKENAFLSAEHTVVADLKKENAELRALMSLGRKGTFRPVFAEVLTRDPMTWQEQFTLDKGSRDGIEPGNLVVTPVYSKLPNLPRIAVIGKVKSVTNHTALVVTILSRDFRLSVSLPDSKSSGILEGARSVSEMQAVLKFLPLNSVPASGQIVYTNAFSGNSPPGLPVGIVADMENPGKRSKANQLYLETGVQPFESPAEVRFAAVFVKEKK